MQLRSGNFSGLPPKSIFTRKRRYFRKVNRRIAFLASLRASCVITNCCQTEGVRFWHLRYPAISWECRSLTDITFRPTPSAKFPCAGSRVMTLQNSFNLVLTSCG